MSKEEFLQWQFNNKVSVSFPWNEPNPNGLKEIFEGYTRQSKKL